MANLVCIWIAFAMGMPLLVNAESFWDGTRCGEVKRKMSNGERMRRESDIEMCIFQCFEASVGNTYVITADECFKDLVEDRFTKYLGKNVPNESEIQDCLDAENRRLCKVILQYHFSKIFKTSYTTSYGKKFARFLFYAWSLDPDILLPRRENNWEHSIAKMLSEIKYENDEDIREAVKVTSVADARQFPLIHDQLRRHCYKPTKLHHTEPFCRIRLLMSIAKKIQTLAKGKRSYGANLEKYAEALKSNFAAFSANYDASKAEELPPSGTEEKVMLLDKILDDIYDLISAGNTRNIQTFVQFAPEPYLLEKACKSQYVNTLVRRCCVLEKVVEQCLIYSSMAEKRKHSRRGKAVTINFSLNLRSVIAELRGEEVFKMVLENKFKSSANQEETANLIEGKFGQLKNYFSKLQNFNMQKAAADVAYVKGRIEYYQGKSKAALDEVSEKVGGILKAATISLGLETAEKTVKLAFAIAEACNPLKWVFNGGSATDIMDATAELMTAISKLTKAIKLQDAWANVIKTAKEINEGFKKNSEFLSSLGIIVGKIKHDEFPSDDEFEKSKSTFLRLYNDYTPQVDKVMLEVLGTKLDTSADSGCDLFEDSTGTFANGYVAEVRSKLYCETAQASISSLTTIFEEIYDFQFELVECMASYLQSSTGYHASQKMVTLSASPLAQSGNPDDRRRELRANVIMAHTTYEIQKQGVITTLCDFLEYQEGGTTPAVCQGSTIDVPTLLSYIPKRCKLVNKYVSIPINISKEVKPGQIDKETIKKLYAGEEVSFNIPDYDWMKKHQWLSQEGSYDAVYIQSFEIFLPTMNRGKKEIEVTVRSMGGNKFRKHGKRYSLIPSESYHVLYTEGSRFFPCSGKEIVNPYSICKHWQLPKLCVMSYVPSLDNAKTLYSTAFAMFKIKAKGITVSQTPKPKTPLDIKARVNMCIFEGEEMAGKKSRVRRTPGCCSGNNYWNETRSVCMRCPTNSTAALRGYYCDEN